MPTRSAIKCLLNSFLSSYISRNSDYCGYWLMGFLVMSPGELRFNLHHPTSQHTDPVLMYARLLAVNKLSELAGKIGVQQYIRSAELVVQKDEQTEAVRTIGPPNKGYKLTLIIIVTDDRGRKYIQSTTAVAAAHNPELEIQSIRSQPT